MQITLTFDTSTPKDSEVLMALLGNLSPADLANFAANAQPEVANTGSTATGFNLSPEGSGVSEPVAAEVAPAAPVKEKRTRKPKEEAAPVAEPEAPAEVPQTEAAEAKTYTLDEVRAALQQFTAKSGVPAGIDLLKTFNAGRISELDAGDYAAFVERCAA